MQVIDEVTGKRIPFGEACCVVTQQIPGTLVYGYSGDVHSIVRFLACVNGSISFFDGLYERLKDHLVYSTFRGCYISTIDFPKDKLFLETHKMGHGEFPYTFERRYEAIESFNIFKDKQVVLHPEEFEISKYLKYTFGLEFETSMGYVPEINCFKDGLIPLRDGSISGLEYSTVVLEGDNGLSLLKQQLQSLKRYTAFNKECSLHIHFGGYPLDPEAIYRLYSLCKALEVRFEKLLPPYTFHSAHYKENGKDYCMKLQTYRSFEQLYTGLVGRPFFGSLSQPHPNDVRREAKWRIPTRYYWVNFINMLCYNVNKTVEFRFLRPTYNFEKIVLWISILNAMMVFAEKNMSEDYRVPKLEGIIKAVYPEPIAHEVILGLMKLQILTDNQVSNGDSIGRDIEFETNLFGQ